jgi:3-methyl-2-oxobutanoate hydroxymethyltransferase
MSRYVSRDSVTTSHLLKRKQEGEKISVVTCYDSSFGRIIEKSPVDVVLVGDSLGNVMLGFDSTISVTLDHMIHHASAVTRVVKRPLVVVDMPFLTCHVSVVDTVRNCGRVIQETGAQAVKIEGGRSIVPQVRALVDSGIPVMGHLGLTPQSVHAVGGYKIQGKTADARKRILEDARLLADAGIFSLVLEMVPADLAKEVTASLRIPTIGIGAGGGCDGQVLVLHDLLGFDESFNPKFLKKYANLGAVVHDALIKYDEEVKAGSFPLAENEF